MTEYILVAVAWPYANGSLHLGHIAGAYLPADIFVLVNSNSITPATKYSFFIINGRFLVKLIN